MQILSVSWKTLLWYVTKLWVPLVKNSVWMTIQPQWENFTFKIIGGSKSSHILRVPPPSLSNVLHFHAVFGKHLVGTNPFGLAPPVLEILNPPLKMFNYKFSLLYMKKSNFPIWPLGLKLIMHRLILLVNVNDAFRSTTRVCIRDLLQIPS